MARTGSPADYARHRKQAGLAGGSGVAVGKAIKTGRISLLADGKIDFDVADIQWERNTRKRADLHASQPTPPSLPSIGDNPPPRQAQDWGDHKSRKEAAEADLKQIELAKKTGELIDRHGAAMAAQKTARILRDALINTLPSKLSLELASITDPWAIECAMRDAIRAELHAIVETMTSLAADAG